MAGNINYSLNKNDFYKILVGGITYFIPYYYALIIISVLYIAYIKYKKYIFSDRNKEYQVEEDTIHYFKSITLGSPFNILSLSEQYKDNDKYIGLSDFSYLYIVIAYSITFMIILEGLIRNLLYSIYVNIIQVNINNNPYNNVNCVQKISDSSYLSTIANYSGIMSISFIFLVPFCIPYLIKFLKYDNYDIKKNVWLPYCILFLVFFPIVMVILSKASFYKKLEIFSSLNKFVETKDYNFIKFISNNFSFRYFSYLIYIFIVVTYCIYKFIFADFKYSFKKKIAVYILIALILFVFLPAVILFFSFANIFANNYKDNLDRKNIVEGINKNGVSSLYELLIKYNYPCFFK